MLLFGIQESGIWHLGCSVSAASFQLIITLHYIRKLFIGVTSRTTVATQ